MLLEEIVVERGSILIVEDEALIAMEMRQRLTDLGYTVPPPVGNAEQAIEQVRQHPPDLVLMDIKLRGEMDGVSAARVIRSESDVPVVFITSYAERETVERAKQVEPSGYLIKPFNERLFEVTVGNALYRHRAEQERREMAQALRESEARFRGLFECAAVGVAQGDVQGRLQACNPALSRILGRSLEELIGRSIIELTHPDDRARSQRLMAELLEAGQGSFTQEKRYLHKEGGVVWARVHVSLLREQAGQPPSLMAVVQDITREREAEQRALQTQLRHAAILESTQDAIVTVDAEQRVVQFNPGAEAIFGYSAGEVLGQPIEMLLPEGRRARHREALGAFIRGRIDRRLEQIDVEGLRKNGEVFDAQTSISSLQFDQTQMFTAVLRDVSVQRKLEQQLRQAQKMDALGRLAGGVAHDLNNLLTGIMLSAELLQAIGGDQAGEPHTNRILAICERARAMIDQLLLFSRRQDLPLQDVEVTESLDRMEKMLARLIGEHIDLTLEMEPALGRVKLYPGSLEQILVNLVVNARDAIDSRGRIVIRAFGQEIAEADPLVRLGLSPGRYLSLAVADDGCGMDPQTRERIFEPFFTTKEVGQGTGLGLSTIYGLVQRAGGAVSVESAPGAGTTMTVLIPGSTDPARDEAATGASGELRPGSELVLLVEDEEDVRTLAAEILRMAGYQVTTAANGRQALERVTREQLRVDLLLTDVVMPEMGGGELAEALRQRLPGLRVLFMSGYSTDRLVEQGLSVQNTRLLHKPLTIESLTRSVREVLDA